MLSGYAQLRPKAIGEGGKKLDMTHISNGQEEWNDHGPLDGLDHLILGRFARRTPDAVARTTRVARVGDERATRGAGG